MVLVYLTNGQVASLTSATEAVTRFYTDQEMSSSSAHDAIAFLDSGGEEVGRFKMVDVAGWATQIEKESMTGDVTTGDVLDYVLDSPRWIAVAESELIAPTRWWVTDIEHVLEGGSDTPYYQLRLVGDHRVIRLSPELVRALQALPR